MEERKQGIPKEIKQISEVVWEIPTSYKPGMQVPARIYATSKLMQQMDAGVFDQITNVATLPGIVKHALCMPDGHWGYGFPIGGVAAFDSKEGVISPGGIGFDINCGMRLVTTSLSYEDVKPKLKELVELLFKTVPAGVGSRGFVKVERKEFRHVIEQGSKWAVEKGYGWEEDLERTENNGRFEWADSSKISEKAISRGITQLGTLGSGNHYLEIQIAPKENVFNKHIAEQLGIIDDNQVVVMFHCGSRGFGHQVASEYLRLFLDKMPGHGIKILDRELACAPFNSKEGQDYFRAMACAANMAFANRQVILHSIREAFSKTFKKDAENLDMHMVYDVCHNTAKLEKHVVDGKIRELIVHRKGATRAFPPGHEDLPTIFSKTGQPVIIGGSMETGSYLLVGGEKAKETFYSTCHGAGRTMSRMQAKREFRGERLQKEMEERGIIVRSVSMAGLAEEAGNAYKDVNEVIETMDIAGVTKKVVSFKPIGNVKGNASLFASITTFLLGLIALLVTLIH